MRGLLYLQLPAKVILTTYGQRLWYISATLLLNNLSFWLLEDKEKTKNEETDFHYFD